MNSSKQKKDSATASERSGARDFFPALAYYIRRHLAILISVVFTVVIFAVVFSLYELPSEAVLYASLISVFALAVIGVFRFAAYYRRHRALVGAAVEAGGGRCSLPPPRSTVESDYQNIIRILEDSRAAALSERDRAATDMNDYYTLWAHQIKTPISAMRLILQSEGGENAREGELDEQLFRIEQYVSMALGYMRSENIAADLVLRRADVDLIIRAAVRRYSRSFIRKHIALEFHDSGLFVVTDEKWLCFVFEQILSNALKYTSSGSITISPSRGSDGSPAVSVIDTGIGIRPEDLPRIGERGFTGYNGHDDKKSTGIGMYLCKKILSKLSHSLEVTSELGKGTEVRIVFTER